MTGNKYEFLYFNVKGYGNMARIILEDLGLAYEFKDVGANWAELKPTTPLGQVPVLVVNGQQIAQSLAICRFLGREHGLVGSSNLDQAIVDMWIYQCTDVRNKFAKMIYTNYENGLKPFLEGLPADLEVFEKRLAAGSDSKHLALGKVTLADYIFFDLLLVLFALCAKCTPCACFDTLPNVKAFFESFGARPKLRAFLERPEIKSQKFTGSPHL